MRPCMSAETSVVSGAAIMVSNRKRFNTAPRARFRSDGMRRRTKNELAKRARRREAKAKAVPRRPLRRAGMNLAPTPRAVDGQQEPDRNQDRTASGRHAVSRSKEPSPDSPLVQDNGSDPQVAAADALPLHQGQRRRRSRSRRSTSKDEYRQPHRPHYKVAVKHCTHSRGRSPAPRPGPIVGADARSRLRDAPEASSWAELCHMSSIMVLNNLE